MEGIYSFTGTVAQLRAILESGPVRFVDSISRDARQLERMATGEVDPLEQPYHDDR